MNSWELNIPISPADFVHLTHTFGSTGQPGVVAPFADTLRRILAPKIPVFEAQSILARHEEAGHQQ